MLLAGALTWAPSLVAPAAALTMGEETVDDVRAGVPPEQRPTFDKWLGFPQYVHTELYGEGADISHPMYYLADAPLGPGDYKGLNQDGLDVYLRIAEWEAVDVSTHWSDVEGLTQAEAQLALSTPYAAARVAGWLWTAAGEVAIEGMLSSIELPGVGVWHVLQVTTPWDPDLLSVDAMLQYAGDGETARLGHDTDYIRAITATEVGQVVSTIPSIDPDCERIARAVYDAAVQQAQADWQARVNIARDLYNAAVEAAKVAKAGAWALRAIKFRNILISCAPKALLGPKAYAICVAAKMAIWAAWMIAIELAYRAAIAAAKAALDYALRHADELLALALQAAAAALEAALRACIENDQPTETAVQLSTADAAFYEVYLAHD